MKIIQQFAIAALALASLSCSSTEPTASSTSVAAIVINPQSPTLALNASLPLQVQVQDASGAVIAGAPVTWSVRDPNIVSVSETGVVTALALGTTEVAATSRGVSAIATITVQRTPVATVVVTPDKVDAVVGSKTPLTAIALDAGQNTLAGRGMVWTTSNAGVATVDGTGVVTGVGPGSATITATSEGKSDASSITISVGAIASVAVTPNPVNMVAGQKTQLASTARDGSGTIVTGKPVIWSSSNTAVANVSSSGEVTAVSGGNATISATVEGVVGSTSVTVAKAPVGSVDVNPKTATITTGGQAVLTATVRDVNSDVVTDRAVAWTSSSPAVATVINGTVTGVVPGTSTITATSEGKSSSATITVTLVPVGSVSVSPTSLALTTGQTGTLSATVTDANGAPITRPVNWSSSNTGVATVTSAGVVTAVAAGSATVTATEPNSNKSGSAAVTVTAPPVTPPQVAAVAVTPSTVALTVGQGTTLSAAVTDAGGNAIPGATVTWSSSNTGVASVSSTGAVTTSAVGTATITATEPGSNKSGTSTITVGAVPVATVAVSPGTASVTVGNATTLSATVTDANGAVVPNASVAWSSNNTTVADVSGGTVTAKAVGTATITASSGGQSGTATITVTAAPTPTPGPAATVTVTPSVASVQRNRTLQLTASAVDANGLPITGRAFTWSSSDSSDASVSSTGLVSGKKIGVVTITARLDGRSGTSVVTITP
jgi:uncharacterized protein YjdB